MQFYFSNMKTDPIVEESEQTSPLISSFIILTK